MDTLIYSVKFTVQGHDVNANKYMTIPALLKVMQESSLQHARMLKTSVWDMENEKITWVLIRKEVKIIEHLRMDESFTLLTYPSGFDKFFAYRDYLIFDSNKKLVVGASSTWTLLQTEDRKLMKIPKRILEIGAPKDTKFLTQPEKRIVLPEEMKKVDLRKVRAYDLDWNNHVNNIVLVRFMMESLKESKVEDDEISKLLIHFKNELRQGERAGVYLRDGNQTLYSALMNSDAQKEIAMLKVTLKAND